MLMNKIGSPSQFKPIGKTLLPTETHPSGRFFSSNLTIFHPLQLLKISLKSERTSQNRFTFYSLHLWDCERHTSLKNSSCFIILCNRLYDLFDIHFTGYCAPVFVFCVHTGTSYEDRKCRNFVRFNEKVIYWTVSFFHSKSFNAFNYIDWYTLWI